MRVCSSSKKGGLRVRISSRRMPNLRERAKGEMRHVIASGGGGWWWLEGCRVTLRSLPPPGVGPAYGLCAHPYTSPAVVGAPPARTSGASQRDLSLASRERAGGAAVVAAAATVNPPRGDTLNGIRI